MTFHFVPYELSFINPFKLSHGTRTGTKALYLVLKRAGHTGYGEATFPPYLDETPENTVKSLEKILRHPGFPGNPNDVGRFAGRFDLSPFSRCLLINAVTDLWNRINNISSKEILEKSTGSKRPGTTFTITKQTPLNTLTLETARQFSMLKLKFDGDEDLVFAEKISRLFSGKYCADVNQGWEKYSLTQAAAMAKRLKELGCVLLEQPFDKKNHDKHAGLSAMGILPVFADEGIQGLQDFELYGRHYDGINIKLLKCGGPDHAFLMAEAAKKAGKKIIVGCMSESSCGCAAALPLMLHADYIDLDGPWLIKNDPFEGLTIENGLMHLQYPEGSGIKPLTDIFLQDT